MGSYPRLSGILAALAAFLTACVVQPTILNEPLPPIQSSAVPDTAVRAVVQRVVDGDTVVLASGERVRYIGIDTPETVHPRKPVEAFGKEASDYNRTLVEGKTVRLEFDVQRQDRYGRLLAYVWVGDVFVNAELVRAGFAQVSTYPPNVKYQELFVRLEREAREVGRGLWSQSGAASGSFTE